MTPGARVAAAIEVIDAIVAGTAPERALTGWARRHRFAGSADRAAIRDLVFDVLRRWWSTAHDGGGPGGRARLIGLLRQQGADLDALFDGTGHAPAPLSPAERRVPDPPDACTALDCPPAAETALRESLGARFAPVMDALRHRAPLFLRVNTRRVDLEGAVAALAGEGIVTVPHPLSPTSLRVEGDGRALSRTRAYATGLVELQDAASQAVVDRLPLRDARRVLDLCAGGGGKSLAMAARADADWFAFDADQRRMADLGPRAARAGVTVWPLTPAALAAAAPFDLVLVDAPCTGSGAWRRAPAGKIGFDRAAMTIMTRRQDGVLDAAIGHVAPGGALAYVTCSLMAAENGDRVDSALRRHPGWRETCRFATTPVDGGDGFFLALLASR